MGQHHSTIPLSRTRVATPASGRPLPYVLVAIAASAIALWGSFGHEGLPSLHFPTAAGVPVAAPAEVALPPVRAAAPTATTRATAPTRAATPTHAPATAPAIVAPAKVKAVSSYTVRYGFDGGAADLSEGVHNAPGLHLVSANGGALRTVVHGTGDGLGFPAPCVEPGASSCPRAILETSGNVSKLNPGTHEVSFGATIKMRHNQTSDGENVVQKGFATGGSEYKLQVDGDAGMPSCAVVGATSSTIYLAKSSVAIDDGAWHTVACDLRAGVLSITVDGTVRGKHAVPTGLSVSNSDELRIGGKGTSSNNDQFNGELDDVWVTVGQ
jgi:Concanavalin A-like lectin/glucanases superfamily